MAELIKEARLAANLTQAQVADRLNAQREAGSTRIAELELVIDLLKEVRLGRHLTQAQLSKRVVSVGQDELSRIESGSRRLGFVELRNLLKAMDIEMVAFVAEYEKRLPTVLASMTEK
ncbi:helix-turn-helix transcriptional regulator [Variovorax sp. J22R133]|uniref:helix-turn-helix domain-containing protein n=1 Tax=Variovorax brevis TaxID=3053503 RepID=UPI00257610B9|nr:helix-turn-helix transcriptional regulator [Variovorax sp. J22R133]MDM0116218.1 helix-turn-helix transcriptional regulator [Variovorax sp. J22R133]